MTAAIFDTKDLNSLFDNQKRLDDLFDSIFDDDNYFICGASSTLSSSPNTLNRASTNTLGIKDILQSNSEKNPYIFLAPIVLEIAAIYFVATHLW